ncbi:MAG: TIGR03943 family protein [Mycobacterium sp.]|nr:TIGR03943 family protein [Mycobacterium sp.]
MNRDAQSLLLVLVGAAITRIAVDHTALQYVRAWLSLWLLVAGSILIAIGLIALVRENGPWRRTSAGGQGSRMRVAWLLVVPVLAIFVIQPGALGAYSAARGGGGVGQAPPDSNGFTPLPKGKPLPDTVKDFSERALWDHGRTLTGRHITLSGFVTPRDRQHFYLTRMLITCCAADASPIEIRIDGGGAGRPANTWVQITGTYAGIDHSQPAGEDPIPIVHAERIAVISQPKNPYAS